MEPHTAASAAPQVAPEAAFIESPLAEGRRLAEVARALVPPERPPVEDPASTQRWFSSSLTDWIGERSAATRRAEEAYLEASRDQPHAVRDTALKEAAQLWFETDRVARGAIERALTAMGSPQRLVTRAAAGVTRKGRARARDLLTECAPRDPACASMLEQLEPEPPSSRQE